MVDVFINTAGNTIVTVMARERWRPPVRELGEVDERYPIGTAEVLSCPSVEGMESKPKKCDRKPNAWQEVGYSHSIEEVCESRWREGQYTS